MISDTVGFAYDCRNVDKLTDFYKELLGWKKILSGNGWAGLRSPQGWVLALQKVKEHELPVWPWKNGKQQQMAHMDFLVKNLEGGVAHALKCGIKDKNKRQKLRKLHFTYQMASKDIRRKGLS